MDTDQRLKYLVRYSYNPISFFTLSDDLNICSNNVDGYIAYKEVFRIALILGDPLVPNSEILEILSSLKNKHRSICFVSCTNRIYDVIVKSGFGAICMGKSAYVDFAKFNLKGGSKWTIRSSLNHAYKYNYQFFEYNTFYERKPSLDNAIQFISKKWCSMKKIPEPKFFVSSSRFNKKNGSRYFICNVDGKFYGYINYFPIFGKNCYYLDHSRRLPNAPRGLIDYLIIQSFIQFKKEKVEGVYLGLSPFYDTLNELNFLINEKLEKRYVELFKFLFKYFYESESEFFFKGKYATDWEPTYIYYYPKLSFNMLLAIPQALFTGGFPSLLFKKFFPFS